MTMDTPHISIIMPVYNGEPTLRESMDSLLHQEYNDWELILVDDGSTDGSLRLLRQYAHCDSRLHVLASAHEGIVAALRRACAGARGDLLARMDADDIALPGRFSTQAAMFKADSRLDLCGARVLSEGATVRYGRKRYASWINRLVCHDAMVRELFVECPIPHPTFMMRRSLYETLGGYREMGWPEDYDFVMRAWMAGAVFGKSETPLLRWREHPRRLSMTDQRYSPASFRRLKRHYLFQTYLKGKEQSFIQWGAGEVGKIWLREWPVPPAAVVDVHPRKIGKKIHGVPVIPCDALPPPGSCFIVVAVGARGARDDIRAWLEPRDYREQVDYIFLA